MAAKQDLQIHNVIIGTAGHIDHGKSSIVLRLTGIDPDRLPDEKSRGLTIDLGFAPFRLKDGRTVGIIDVPGHERFIKNMVAGATSIDFVMLVVAADDSVMPQTREHLTIMSLLGVRRGLVVINKTDIVDEDMTELVAEEVKDVVRGTFLEGAPVLKVSAKTGAGFEELIDVINRLVAETPPHLTEGVFRMPIQRVFSVKGFGTIVTGVPVTGRAEIGDTLEILPLGKQGRVRTLNAYKSEVREVRAGHSSAINISDVDHSQVHRGMVAATPGVFRPAYFVEARMRYLPEHGKPLPNRMPIKLHVGTAEADGRVVLLDKKQLVTGDEALVQFRLEEPVVVADGDPFIVRLQSPLFTIGGGRILDISSGKLKRFREQIERRLTEKEAALSDPGAALEFYLKDCGHRLITAADVAASARAPEELIREPLEAILKGDHVVRVGPRKFVHKDVLDSALDLLQRRLGAFHEKNPLRVGMEIINLKRVTGFEDDFFTLARDAAVERKAIVVENEKARLASFRVELSKEDTEAAVDIEGLIRDTRFSTPREDEIQERFPRYSKDRIKRVIKLLVDQGAVVSLKEGVLVHSETVEEAKKIVGDLIQERGSMEAAQFRDKVGTTRKYVIPLLEHLDNIGFTRRQGNARVLRQKK